MAERNELSIRRKICQQKGTQKVKRSAAYMHFRVENQSLSQNWFSIICRSRMRARSPSTRDAIYLSFDLPRRPSLTIQFSETWASHLRLIDRIVNAFRNALAKSKETRGKSWNQLHGGIGGHTRPTQDSLARNKKRIPQDWSISSSSELIEIRYDGRCTQCR